MDKGKEFFGELLARDLPTGAAGLIGIVLILFVFRIKKIVMKIVLLLIALALFAGAYWWHTQR